MQNREWLQGTEALPRKQADEAFATWRAANISPESPLPDGDIRMDLIHSSDRRDLVRYWVRLGTCSP